MHDSPIQRRLGARSRIQGLSILYSLILRSHWPTSRLVGSTSTLIQLGQSELTANRSLGYTLRSPQSYALSFLTDPDRLPCADSWLPSRSIPPLPSPTNTLPPPASLFPFTSIHHQPTLSSTKPHFHQVYHQRWLVPSRLPVSITSIIFYSSHCRYLISRVSALRMGDAFTRWT